jgi:NAD(P)-dependent dehydrogenase (short-subunit alcohol dehydrogenase family)
MSFDGRRVVIIGASAGIGEAAARAFAARGATVTITGRSKERLDQAAQRIGHPVDAAEVDATSRAAVSPVRRVGQPDDVADAIVYLAGAAFVTGTILECTGGSNLTAAALTS